MKVLVTGSMRSGTTYMASLLNSQDGLFCVEDFPYREFPRTFQNREQFDLFVASMEAKFIYLGLPVPKLRSARNEEHMIELYFEHLKNHFGCNHIGLKRTMMSKQEMAERIRGEGWKIILMKRPIKKILQSWVRRIDPSLATASARLQIFLESIDYYDLGELASDVKVIELEDLVENREKVLEELSEFLSFDLKQPEVTFHSFNKGRFPFTNNSSFHDNCDDGDLVRQLLEKYTSEDFERAANNVATGKALSTKIKGKFLVKKIVTILKRWLR